MCRVGGKSAYWINNCVRFSVRNVLWVLVFYLDADKSILVWSLQQHKGFFVIRSIFHTRSFRHHHISLSMSLSLHIPFIVLCWLFLYMSPPFSPILSHRQRLHLVPSQDSNSGFFSFSFKTHHPDLIYPLKHEKNVSVWLQLNSNIFNFITYLRTYTQCKK